MKQDPQVVMVGLGYIGLPTAALIASQKISVLGVDIRQHVVDTINRGEIHIVEPDLDGLVKHVVELRLLKASNVPAEAQTFIVAVPTPFKENHQPDISYVEAATQSVVKFLRPGNLFIIESTSPVGTTEKIGELIYTLRPELRGKIYLAYCPERVLPGNVLHELKQNDRVIGGINSESTDAACEFYSRFVQGQLHKTNARTAEMCKLVENSYRDVNIAFANELSMICDQAKINTWELIQLANRHPRVKILQPGTGVGGHCIAVDPWFIVSDFKEHAKLIHQARLINDYKTNWVIEKIEVEVTRLTQANKTKPVVACFGLAFKPDIDDLRESPALEVALHLNNHTNLIAVEPHVEKHDKLKIVDIEEALEQADLIVLLVAHKAFKPYLTSPNMKNKSVIDFVGLLANVNKL